MITAMPTLLDVENFMLNHTNNVVKRNTPINFNMMKILTCSTNLS
jgi:hypothetical protein